ncbi:MULTISPECIES: TIGR04500 family putative peptide maturation system protein [unclassified Nonomuraea]
MTQSSLGPALESAVNLLRGLTRRRSAVAEAHRTADAWAAAHPSLGAQLVASPRPGSPLVDYDLLIDDLSGGTIMIGVQADDGASWLVDHSTHWAASRLLTVNGTHVSVSEAMLMLRSLTRPGLSPQDELVRLCFLRDAAAKEQVTLDDIQAAADSFRRRRDLTSRDAMKEWLDRMGLSAEAFHDHMAAIARDHTFRTRMRDELGPEYLARHRDRFARVRAAWVVSDDEVDVAELHGSLADRWELQLTKARTWSGDLPSPLREAPAGGGVGPVPFEGRFLTGLILERQEAVEDADTLKAAGEAAFDQWLADAAQGAQITWHWL